MNIFDYTDVFTGKKGNVLNLGSVFGKILGVFMFLFTFGLGQRIYTKVDNAITQVDAGIDPLYREKKAPSGPSFKIV